MGIWHFFYQWEWLEQGKLGISGRISFQSEGIPFFQSHQGDMFVDVNIPKCSFYRFMAKVCRALRVAACSSGVRDQLEILPSGTSDSSLHPANLTWNIWHPHESTKEKVEDDDFPIYFPLCVPYDICQLSRISWLQETPTGLSGAPVVHLVHQGP